MANKEINKIPVDKPHFIEVLKSRGSSIRQLGADPAYNEIQRTEKTIRRCLDDGEMPPDLLDRIARYLNVHPDYLSGAFQKTACIIKDEKMKQGYLQFMEHERYPYVQKAISNIEYPRFLEEILLMNHVTWEQFLKLGPSEKVSFQKELFLAMYEVLAKYSKLMRSAILLKLGLLSADGQWILKTVVITAPEMRTYCGPKKCRQKQITIEI